MSSKSVAVHVKPDHIKRLASVGGKPLNGILELIWNALDADANRVTVTLTRNPIEGLERISVKDDGHGIDPARVEGFFGNLGGSWKKSKCKTDKNGRALHGSLGKGRFKAFGLGSRVEWMSRFADDGGVKCFSIIGQHSDLKRFELTEVEIRPGARTGTEVQITNPHKDWISLSGTRARLDVAEAVAVYLEAYPGVEVIYEGQSLNPSEAQICREDYEIGPVETDEGLHSAELSVIEWRNVTSRRLYLCDAEGCTLNEISPGIQAPGRNFTAYLRSNYVRHLEAENLLETPELHPGLSKLIGEAKVALREHFAQREAQAAEQLLQRWKEEDVYPYEGDAKSPVEGAERQVFDVVAVRIDRHLPDFSERDVRGRRLTFRLVRQALEESPEALATILTEVLELPEKERQDFAKLLKRTSLSSIINASKVVTDRLSILTGLGELLFDPEHKKSFKERTQLHRILAAHTWLFGEEFHLMVDDQGLTVALRAVMEKLSIEVGVLDPVRTHTGGSGIVDLMFGRAKNHWGGEGREFLVVELKRPTVKIDGEAISQCMKYARAIASHERFVSTDTRWTFWAVSNELDDYAKMMTSQKHRPPGLVFEQENLEVWAMDWGTLLRRAQSRHEFFRQQLDVEIQADDAMRHLREQHAKLLPKSALK